jgi:hypothetical protein
LPKEVETKSRTNLKRKKLHMYSDELSDRDSDLSDNEELANVSLKKKQ